MTAESSQVAIVVGASGGIGGAITQRFLEDEQVERVIGISRHSKPSGLEDDQRLLWRQSDSSETSMAKICEVLTKQKFAIRYLVIASGVLHDEEHNIQPEKRLSSVNLDALERVFSVNAFIPVLWLKHLSPLMTKEQKTTIAVLSARVGSIGDNRLGGWYSYRSSKAALNMLLQTLAVEYRQRFPKMKVISFHPGTTDTALSKPFQANVAPEKLFEPEFVAEQLYQLLYTLEPDGKLGFLDWNHQPIDW